MGRICGTEGIHVLLNNAGVAPKSTRINMVKTEIERTSTDLYSSGYRRADDFYILDQCRWTSYADKSGAIVSTSC